MNWYHIKVVSKDPAGRKVYIKAESEDDAERRVKEIYSDELEILQLHTMTVSETSDGLPQGYADPESTNIAFDEYNNRLE